MKNFSRNLLLVFSILLLFSQVLALKLSYGSKNRIYASDAEVESRLIEKRGAASAFLKFLAATAGISTVGTVAISAYVDANGCCKPYNFCPKQNALAGFHEQWLKKSEEINDIALKGSLQITSINSIHTNNEIIRIKLVKIIRDLDKLVHTLFEDDLGALKKVQAQIDQIYRANKDNMKTWTEKDFNIHFQGVWGDPAGMALLFGPVLFEAGSYGLSKYLQYSRMRKIERQVQFELSEKVFKKNFHKGGKVFKMLQGSKYTHTSLVKETALSRYKASFEAGSSFKKAAGGFFSLMVTGFNIWQVADYAKRCTEAEEEVDKSYARFTAQLKKLDEDKTKITKANVDIKEAYDLLTKSISADDFLAGVENIEDLVRGGSTQNTETKDDADAIKQFREQIVNAVKTKNNAVITQLQKKLSDSLGRVEYHYDCFLKKATTMRELLTGCKKGRADLQTLYDEKKNSLAACILKDDKSTPPYLSYTDVENAVRADAGKNNYQINCRINNPNLKKLICSEYCETHPQTTDIEGKYKVSNTEVKSLCANYLCALTVSEKNTICLFKQLGYEAEVATSTISAFKKPAGVAHFKNTCPAAPKKKY